MIKYFLRLLRFSFQELKSQFRIQTYLIFNLAFGIFGFLVLQIFQNSLLTQAQSKAQELLAADFSISARRIFDPNEIKKMESEFEFLQKSEVKSFFAMAANDTKTRLVQVIAIDEQYPIYGNYKFKSDQGFSSGRKIWIDRDLVLPLSLTDKSKIKIGQIKFNLEDTIVTDPTRAFSPGGFAPVVYIPMNELPATELIQAGSTVNHRYLYKLKSQTVAADIQKKLSLQIKDTTIKFETASENAKSGNQILKYFMDYLGLVSLVALGLSFLCGGYLLRWIFIEQKKNIAIYKTLGLQNSEIVQIQIIKNTLISLVAFGIAAVVTVSILPVLQNLIAKYNLPVVLIFGGYSFILTLVISIFVPQMVLFPLLIEMVQLSARELFQAQVSIVKKRNVYWIWLGICLTLFWVLTIFQSQSIKTGTAFTAGLVVLYLVFRMVLFLILKFLNSQLHKMTWFNRYALLGLIRRRQATDLVFVTMSLAILVLCLLPHIKSSIIEEIKPTSDSQIPKLFLFDIQSDQQSSLKLLTEQQIGQKLEFTPLVRSRILKLNDENYERNQSEKSFTTREDEDDARFRNRGVNLTYKTKLQPSEKIVEGRWNEGRFVEGKNQNTYPEISLEEKYADRIGAKLNDFMTFDVQGLEIKARVTSIRQVRWTSFQPNFFILFQAGVLEDAPQVFISSIANIDPAVIDSYQSTVVAAHPNVSIINVQQTVASIVIFIDQMSIALQAMAYLSMVVGLFVFVVLLNTQIRDRVVEMNLLQILGLPHDSIIKIVRRQFIFLLVIALASGLLLSLISATIIVKFVFNIGVVFDWNSMWSICILLVPVSLIGIHWGMRPLAKLSPSELIRNQ